MARRKGGYNSSKNRRNRARKARNRRNKARVRRQKNVKIKKRKNAQKKRRRRRFGGGGGGGRVYHGSNSIEGSDNATVIIILVVVTIVLAIPFAYPVLGCIGGYFVGMIMFLTSDESGLIIAGWIMLVIAIIIIIAIIICILLCIGGCFYMFNTTMVDKWFKRLGKKKDKLEVIAEFGQINVYEDEEEKITEEKSNVVNVDKLQPVIQMNEVKESSEVVNVNNNVY